MSARLRRARPRAVLLAALLGAAQACATGSVDPDLEDFIDEPDSSSAEVETPGEDTERSFAPRFVSRTNSLFANVLDRKEVGWASVRDLSSSEFSADFDKRRDAGMMPLGVDVIEAWGQQRVSAVWQDNVDGRSWQLWRDMSSADFGAKWTALRSQGYILIDQDCYQLGGSSYYAGVWIQNREGLKWTSFRNATSSTYAAKFNEYRAAGYMPIDIEVYPSGSGVRYSAIWVENNESRAWVALRDMSSDSYAQKFDLYKNSYRVMDLQSYRRSGSQSYAAIWVSDELHRGWYAYRDMSEKSYAEKWKHLRDLGYRVVDFEEYPTAFGHEYAAVWRQTNDRPNWAHRAEMDSILDSAMAEFDIPGMSVAIAVNGSFKYMRGFGKADTIADRAANSRTVYRLASGSKALAGTLALDLEERGLFDVSKPTRFYAPSMPTFHTHTVWQTLTNRSGIGHYDENGSPSPLADFDTAALALGFFQNKPLQSVPGTAYLYSTHAYTAAGAAIEGALRRPIADVVRTELTERYDLGTLKVEDRGDGNDERASLYVWSGLNNLPVPADNTSWKILGGGLEANAYDYVRFGIKLLGGDILGPAALSKMWTKPDSLAGYGYGWDLGKESCQKVVAKSGAQVGANSYLRIYPDAKIVIAVLTNRQNGDHSATAIGRDLGAVLVRDLCP